VELKVEYDIRGFADIADTQGLTLVHFSAYPEHISWQTLLGFSCFSAYPEHISWQTLLGFSCFSHKNGSG
jgi:hypothetical protein